MAPKKKIEAKVHKRAAKFFAYLKQGDVAPRVIEELYTADPWVHHDFKNDFPERLRELVDNCGPLERAITMEAKFIAGHGMRFYGPPVDGKQGPELPAAQTKFQEWMAGASEEEFLWRCAYDLAHGLGVCFTVRRSATQIVRLDHLDRFGLRSGKLKTVKVEGVPGLTEKRVTTYYWSANWARYESNKSDERFKPQEIPAWYPLDKPKAMSVVFRKNYRPREPYYGGLSWLGAWTAAEVWTKVDNYNRTQLDTGFMAGMMAGFRFAGTEAEWDKFDEAFEEAYCGPNARGLLTYQLGPDEKEPAITPIERGNHAGELDAMKTGAADTIYDVKGIPSLLMRDRAEGLTSQERAIAIRLQQMQNTVIRPLQKFITQPIQQLMVEAGIDVYEVKIDPLQVFDPAQSESEILASRTVNESRQKRGEEPMKGPDGDELLAKVKGGSTQQDLEAKQDALEKTLAVEQERVPANGNGKEKQKERERT